MNHTSDLWTETAFKSFASEAPTNTSVQKPKLRFLVLFFMEHITSLAVISTGQQFKEQPEGNYTYIIQGNYTYIIQTRADIKKSQWYIGILGESTQRHVLT